MCPQTIWHSVVFLRKLMADWYATNVETGSVFRRERTRSSVIMTSFLTVCISGDFVERGPVRYLRRATCHNAKLPQLELGDGTSRSNDKGTGGYVARTAFSHGKVKMYRDRLYRNIRPASRPYDEENPNEIFRLWIRLDYLQVFNDNTENEILTNFKSHRAVFLK